MKVSTWIGAFAIISGVVLTTAGASSAHEEWKCVPNGDCSSYFGQIICPPRPEYPAGLCTRCTASYSMATCTGMIAATCTPQMTELKC